MEFKASICGDRNNVGLGCGFLETALTIPVTLLESAKTFVIKAVHPDNYIASG